ncbi:hypothetical protein AB0Q95_19855 [Streptomyces sp. NPDC059900]|uniref:hypothetical protein n=1 Tax=Streptomyces sp. NPDC059900 TaxID=3155816 RepID=UPI0034350180
MTDTTASKAPSGLKLVRDFFGLKLTGMKTEWTNGGLTDADKAQITEGLKNGTLTYCPSPAARRLAASEWPEASRATALPTPQGLDLRVTWPSSQSFGCVVEQGFLQLLLQPGRHARRFRGAVSSPIADDYLAWAHEMNADLPLMSDEAMDDVASTCDAERFTEKLPESA